MKTKVYMRLLTALTIILCISTDILFYDKPSILNISSGLSVVLPIIVSVNIAVVTILSISLSLQKEKIYGLYNSDFNKIRSKIYLQYSFLQICLISIFFILWISVSYLFCLYISCIGALLLLIIYSSIFCCEEIPLLNHNKKRINSILIKYLDYLYSKEYDSKDQETTKIVNKCLVNMAYEESIEQVYWLFKKDDKEYNKRFLIDFLNMVNKDAFQMQKSENEVDTQQKYKKIVIDLKPLVNFSIDLTEISKEDNLTYLVTRNLFAIRNSASFDEKKSTLPEIFDMIFLGLVIEKNERHTNFLLQIIQNSIIFSVKTGDLYFLNILLDKFNENKLFSHSENLILLFNSIHFYINYLIYLEPSYPKIMKDNLKIWKYKEVEYKGDNLICSFYDIYNKKFHDVGKFSLPTFIDNYESCHWEFYFNNEAHTVQLSSIRACEWFLIQKIKFLDVFEFEKLYEIEDKYKVILKETLKNWFDEEKNINIDYLLKNKEFYDIDDEFVKNINNNYIKDKLWNLKNTISFNQIIEEKKKNIDVEDNFLSHNISKYISDTMSKGYGYSNELISDDTQKQLIMLVDKGRCSQSLEVYAEAFCHEMWREILSKTKYKIMDFDDPNKFLNYIRKKNINVSSFDIKSYFELREVEITDLKSKEYINSIKKVEQTANLPYYFMFSEKYYNYSFALDEVSIKEIDENTLNDYIEKIKREDGQYVYEGVFMDRYQAEKMIKENSRVLKVLFRISVLSNEQNCICLNLFNIYDKK